MISNRATSIAGAALLFGASALLPALKAAQSGDAADVSKLLADAKAEAVELKSDSGDLDAFARSKLAWETHAHKIEMIKEHLNNTGKLLSKLKAAEDVAEPWQKTAISRIEPLLKELAGNTESLIEQMNNNRARIHLPEFRECVRANYELAADLEALIRDFINYGEAKQRLERLGRKLEVTE